MLRDPDNYRKSQGGGGRGGRERNSETERITLEQTERNGIGK